MGWIARKMGWDEDLEVEVGPDAFVFRTPRGAFRMAAEVGPGVLGGGALPGLPTYAPPSSTIPLFPTTSEPAPARYDHLRAFLHAGLLRAVDDRVLKLRPRVVMHGAASLDAVLHGYQYDLLRRAALEAGARSVRFAGTGADAPPAGFERAVSPADLQEQGRYRRA